MDVEERLKATAPAPPPELKAAILEEAKRRSARNAGVLVPLAASFLLCAALLAGLLPRGDARPGTAQDVERVRSLISRLGDADAEARESAARELRDIGPGAREALRGALKDGDPEIRSRAAALLEDVALLPVPKELRGALDAFLARSPARAAEGAARLAAVERGTALKSLEILVAEGGPRMRTRAEQLRRILKQEGPVRYGLVVLEPAIAAGEPAGALELWVNDSPGPVVRAGWRGSDIDYFAEGDEAGELLYRMFAVGEQEAGDLREDIKAGGTAAVVWKDLLPLARRPGRFEIRHHTSLLFLKPGTGGMWGSAGLQSNTVTITIR